MKKILGVIVACISLSIGMVFIGCSFEPEVKSVTSGGLDRKDVLALSHLKKTHTTDEAVLRSELAGFLKESSAARSAGSNASVITNVSVFSTGLDKGFSASARNTRSVSEDTQEEAEIPFYVYTLENEAEETKGFALASGDDRIGNILAVAENGVYDEEHPFLDIFYANLDGYIQETLDIYNSITDEDIQNALEKTGGAERAVLANVTSDPAVIMKTRWNQNPSPYWDIVNEARGRANYSDANKYLTGCIPTAAAQIMAFHKYPAKCSASGYTNITYNWNDMTSYPDARYISNSSARRGIAALMHEVGLKSTGIKYDTESSKDGTTAYLTPDVFIKMGYTTPCPLQAYDFSLIMKSIDAKKPVAITGHAKRTVYWRKFLGITVYKRTEYSEGHAWVIDGYRVNNLGVYVHCNLGWGGHADGWYYSGVFDTNNVREATRAADKDGYYAYRLGIIPHITRP
ncbi:MAG: C10 family peptidase [Spirochaetaceae bacterium]|nr:C10 family peptidase [Spirochaetaceae bacterium]